VKEFWRKPVTDEVDDELSFHVEMRVRELVARGLDPDTARRQAIARFGDYRIVSDTCKTIADERERDMRRTEYVSELRDDTRFAFRQLLKNPGFTLVAVLTLALGIGATTAIFSAVRAVVLRPYAYAEPERVYLVGETWQANPIANVSVGNFAAWKTEMKSWEQLAAINYTSFNLNEGDTPERVFGAMVSWNYFATFGARPILGRVFSADEDQPGRDQVVVLSHELWERRFGGDSSVLGRDVRLNGRPHTIVGVMRPNFDPALAQEQMWVPIAFTPERLANYDEHYLNVYGQLKATVSPAQAQSELETVGTLMRQRVPVENQGRGIAMRRLDEFIIGSFRQRLYVMLGAVALVLLIACGNVANLLLARGAARAKELAIRTAIGAGKERIIRQLLTESVVLSFLGAVVGVSLAWALITALVSAAPASIPRIGETRVDAWVLLFALGASVVSAVAFGLVPALRAGGQDLQPILKEGGRGHIMGAKDRVRTVLVMAEVALSLTLLVGAGLLIRSALYLQRVDPGFQVEGLLAARVGLPPRDAEFSAQAARTFEQIVDAVREQPGVASASLTSQAPLGPGGNSNGLLPEGRPIEASSAIDARMRMVMPGYFETTGIRLIKGRDFTAQDVRSAPLVMVVTEALAQRAWPNEDVIGKRIACCEGLPHGSPSYKTIVGVVNDIRSRGPAQDARPEFFLPIAQVPPAAWTWQRYAMTIVARARNGDAASLTPAIRAAVKRIEPTVPVYSVAVVEESLRNATAPQRFNTMLLAALGAIGLLLAAVGIYSVIAYFVSLRTQEIGIRMALGASTGDVLRLMTWQGVRPVLAGVALGGVGAFWATRLLAGSLFGVSARDPLTFGAVASLLIVVSVLATLVPARRATRVDPVKALG
jgi:putative ABC transport system permease protein